MVYQSTAKVQVYYQKNVHKSIVGFKVENQSDMQCFFENGWQEGISIQTLWLLSYFTPKRLFF